MKTNELSGAALDWAVAKCEGRDVLVQGNIVLLWVGKDSNIDYCPSENWEQGGAIIERERISLLDQGGDRWLAICGWKEVFGDTQLIAAMRCYVASKLGDEVQIPEELIDENAY